MENGDPRDQDRNLEEMSMQIVQLQALTVELKTGLVGALQDLSVLKQSNCVLEERMRNQQNDIEEKILGIRKSFDTFKEDLSDALSQIKEVNCRHAAMQKGVELFQAEVEKHLLAHLQRKNPKDGSPDCPQHFPSETAPNVMQHYPARVPNCSAQQTTSSEQDDSCLQQGWTKPLTWTEPQDPTKGETTEDSRKRYAAALKLLESERLYVSHLSLLLKANITFNSTESMYPKGKRPFPSSLRFLIQHHLELLHTLQERVLRFQWQGIMGDVFLRLFSKESDFLDFYLAYLKELPECLAVVSMDASSSEAAGLFEGDFTGKETRLPLRTLLLQPVQRIPEYLTLLQNLLKLTEAEHPDYFLLLVCVQQLRAFLIQHSHLLQQSQELLLHSCREVKRQNQNQVKRQVLEQGRCREPQDRESVSTFFGDEANHPWLTVFPEGGREPSGQPPASSSAPKFLPPPPVEMAGLDVLYEDVDSLANVSLSLFENASTVSSDSSLDIAFIPPSGGYAAGQAHSQLPKRGCASPDQADLRQHHPLEAVQCKSKSLNGLQLDSTVCGDAGQPKFPGTPKTHGPHGGAHARLERQSSRGSLGGMAELSTSPWQKLEPQDLPRNLHKMAPSQTTAPKVQLTTSSAGGPQAWGEDCSMRRGSEENLRSFSERSRKEDQKGGFRSSFRKLFKKKSGGEIKERTTEKTELEAHSGHEGVKSAQLARPLDRGTAV